MIIETVLGGSRIALGGSRIALGGSRIALSGSGIALGGSRIALGGSKIALGRSKIALGECRKISVGCGRDLWPVTTWMERDKTHKQTYTILYSRALQKSRNA